MKRTPIRADTDLSTTIDSTIDEMSSTESFSRKERRMLEKAGAKLGKVAAKIIAMQVKRLEKSKKKTASPAELENETVKALGCGMSIGFYLMMKCIAHEFAREFTRITGIPFQEAAERAQRGISSLSPTGVATQAFVFKKTDLPN